MVVVGDEDFSNRSKRRWPNGGIENPAFDLPGRTCTTAAPREAPSFPEFPPVENLPFTCRVSGDRARAFLDWRVDRVKTEILKAETLK